MSRLRIFNDDDPGTPLVSTRDRDEISAQLQPIGVTFEQWTAACEVKPGDTLSGLVVTFVDQASEIAGTLFDAAGRPTPEFSIVVFATDRALWSQLSRRIRATRPASDGTFKITGLPAGTYHLAAVTDYEPNEIYDPAFLELLQGASYKITLGDGEKKRQDLKVAGGGT